MRQGTKDVVANTKQIRKLQAGGVAAGYSKPVPLWHAHAVLAWEALPRHEHSTQDTHKH